VAKDRRGVKRVKLAYPQHRLKPEDLLDFIETRRFTADWEDLGLNDDDFTALQIGIISSPKEGAVMKGTGGLRKLRFAPAQWNTGKSGAVRICYAYFEEYSLVFLVRAYGKNEKDDLADEEKRGIRQFLERIGKELAARPVRHTAHS
jgi:hypothetical protein